MKISFHFLRQKSRNSNEISLFFLPLEYHHSCCFFGDASFAHHSAISRHAFFVWYLFIFRCCCCVFCSYPGLASIFLVWIWIWIFVVAGVVSMTYSWNQVKQFSNWGAHGIYTTIHVAVVRQWCRHGLKVNFIQHAARQKDIVGFVHVEVFAWLLFIFYAPKNGII